VIGGELGGTVIMDIIVSRARELFDISEGIVKKLKKVGFF